MHATRRVHERRIFRISLDKRFRMIVLTVSGLDEYRYEKLKALCFLARTERCPFR